MSDHFKVEEGNQQQRQQLEEEHAETQYNKSPRYDDPALVYSQEDTAPSAQIYDDTNVHSHTSVSASSSEKHLLLSPQNTLKQQNYEFQLSEYDAIMNPEIIDVLRAYISSGGDPAVAVAELAAGYKSYAQMSNSILSWMRMIGFSKRELNNIVVEFLKNEIKDNFDPKRADDIFSLTNDVPQWLDFMISHSDWRNLIYDLSERYPNSLMLNFAIQRIGESGYQNEIASVTTASSSFRVFHKVLTDAIDNLANINEDTLYNSHTFNDFKKICCYSEHTYIYAQCLLHALCNNAGKNSLFKRLSEELEMHLLKEEKCSESFVRKIGFLFDEYDYRLTDIKKEQKKNQMSDVAAALLSMLVVHATNPADVAKLHKLYTSNNPPPVHFLQHPDVFQLFIADMFDPSKKIPIVHLTKYIYVLALAASSVIANQPRKTMNDITQGLQNAIQICSNKTSPLNLNNSVATLRKCISINVVCLGILHWITVVFVDSEHAVSVYSINNTKIYMALLKEIAYWHSSLRPNVLQVLVKIFEMKNDLDALQAVEIKRLYLEVFIYLLQLGYVIPTMHALNKIVKDQLDLALIRSILSQLLDMIEEPYSDDFVSIFVDILCTFHVVDALKKSSITIRPFVQYVLDNSSHRAHLSQSQLNVLNEYMKE